MTPPGSQAAGDGPAAADSIVDWGLASRVARSLAGNGTGKRSVRRSDLRRAARGSVGLVRDFTGLETKGRLPPAEAVDRREWIDANLSSLRAMSREVEAELAASLQLPGPLGPAMRALAGAAAGVEMGIVSGFLARRVLGQYDVALVGPSRPARLLFVAPNLAEAQKSLGAERETFLRWIAIHEATHVVQFSAVPWLREHIGGIGEELLGGAFAQIGARELARGARRLLNPDPRPLIEAIRNGDWTSPFISTSRRRLVGRLQTTMAIVEGYSEHVMDGVGEQLDPAYGELRRRLEARRARSGPLEALLSRLFGIEMKMRQYRLGKAFCDEVAERRGIATLNRVWSEPAALPRPAELERPGRWLRPRRLTLRGAGSGGSAIHLRGTFEPSMWRLKGPRSRRAVAGRPRRRCNPRAYGVQTGVRISVTLRTSLEISNFKPKPKGAEQNGSTESQHRERSTRIPAPRLRRSGPRHRPRAPLPAPSGP